MSQGRRGRPRAERGQSIVEFSLVLPVALLILALVVDAGQFIVGSINLNQVARASATAAAFAADHGASTVEVESEAVSAAVADQPGVAYNYCDAVDTPPCVAVAQVPTPTIPPLPPDCGTPGLPPCLQTVTVYQDVSPIVPLFPGMTLQATASSAY